MIRDLDIKDPDRNPYVTLDEWLAEAPKPPKGFQTSAEPPSIEPG